MSAAALPRRKRDLRREVEVLRQTRGVYVCGACDRLIPLGFAHEKVNGGPCAVRQAVKS